MSSNEEQHQPSASSAIPLLVPHKKKQSGKPKARVRPTRGLKKNVAPQRKLSAAPAKRGAAAVIPTRSKSNAAAPTPTPAPASTIQKEASTAAPSKGPAPIPVSMPTAGAAKPSLSRTKVLPRKPARKAAKAIRPSKVSSAAKKGLSINVGSSVNKPSSIPIRAGSSRIAAGQSQPQESSQQPQEATPEVEEQTQIQSLQVGPYTAALAETNQPTSETAQELSDQIVPNLNGNTVDEAPQVDIIPYQHLGQIDPTLNIAPPKANEKAMKDFCSKFKIPRSKRSKKKDDNATNANDANNPAEGTATGNVVPNAVVGSTSADVNAQPEEERDSRSGPLVEIVNGEIVIKESSMIVGGRRTTEEVDREMEGAVVVEENTGITATYNSFTKRQKVKRWSVQETRKFFLALRQCGTDFSTMENFFDGTDGGNKRTRKQLKSKYKRECRKNLKLIDMAMDPKVQLPLDMSVFGDLDMEAVEGTVVPLGQASVATGGEIGTNDINVGEVLDRNIGAATPLQTSEDGGEGEPEVVVETFGEENSVATTAVVTQTQDSDGVGASSAATGTTAAALVTPAAADDVGEEENNIPLLAMPTITKRKPRPKFRASRAKPKAKVGAKGKAKPKRAGK